MPNTKSAKRRMRNSARKQVKNKSIKSALKTLKRKLTVASKEKKGDESKKLYLELTSALDKAAKKGIIHKNNASRNKARLSKLVNAKPAAAA